MNQTKSPQIVILGGGISGLTLAWKLEQALLHEKTHAHITLLESTSELGGKVQTRHESGAILECGPDSLHVKDPALLSLLTELQLESDIISPKQGGFYIYRAKRLERVQDGLLKPFPHNLSSIFLNERISLLQKARALLGGCLPYLTLKEDVPLSKFLRYRFGNRLSKNFFEPLVGGIYGSSPDLLSTAYYYPQLWKHRLILPYLVLRTWLQSIRKSKRTKTGGASVVSLKHGLSSLPSRISSQLKHTKILNETCAAHTSFDPEKQLFTITSEDGRTLHADYLFCALPAKQNFELLDQLLPEGDKSYKNLRYTSSAICSLIIEKADFLTKLPGTGFLVPEEENLPIAACTFTTQKWPYREIADGLQIVRVFLRQRGNFRLGNLTNEQITRLAIDSLEDIFAVKLNVHTSKIKRWEENQPIYKPGYRQMLQKIETACEASFSGRLSLLGEICSTGIPDNMINAASTARQFVQKLNSEKSKILSFQSEIEQTNDESVKEMNSRAAFTGVH